MINKTLLRFYITPINYYITSAKQKREALTGNPAGLEHLCKTGESSDFWLRIEKESEELFYKTTCIEYSLASNFDRLYIRIIVLIKRL